MILIPYVSYSQADVSIGSPYRVIDAEDKYYFHQDDEIMSVKINNAISIQKFNAQNLRFQKIKVYDDMPNGHVIERVMEFNNRYFVFYSLWDRKNEKEQLFYREIDFKEGAFIGKGTRIVTVDGKITGSFVRTGFYRFGVVDKFGFQLSFDESKMLIQYRLKPEIRSDAKSYDIIGMSIFDKEMALVWNKEVKMPYTEKKMNILDYSIDSEGNTFILSTVYEDNTTDVKKKKDEEANYHIELLRIKANSSDITVTPVSLKDKFINKLWLYESPFGYMICAGFYNNGKDLDDADGILMFNVGKEGELFEMVSYEIPVEILNQYASKKSVRKNDKKDEEGSAEFANLELRKLIVDEDGGVLLIGEQYYMVSHTSYSTNGRMSTYYTYHYNDMLITKINGAGNLAWMRKLPKRQIGGRGQGGMSYEYLRVENDHYFLFLDNEKNLDLPLDEVPANHSDGKGGFLTSYKIKDTTGEVRKTSILDTRNVKGMEVYQFLTSRIVPLKANEFAFEVYKKRKEDIFVKVVLND